MNSVYHLTAVTLLLTLAGTAISCKEGTEAAFDQDCPAKETVLPGNAFVLEDSDPTPSKESATGWFGKCDDQIQIENSGANITSCAHGRSNFPENSIRVEDQHSDNTNISEIKEVLTDQLNCDATDCSSNRDNLRVTFWACILIIDVVIMIVGVVAFIRSDTPSLEIDDDEILEHLSAPARGYLVKCIRVLIARKDQFQIEDRALRSLERIEKHLVQGKMGEVTMENDDLPGDIGSVVTLNPPGHLKAPLMPENAHSLQSEHGMTSSLRM